MNLIDFSKTIQKNDRPDPYEGIPWELIVGQIQGTEQSAKAKEQERKLIELINAFTSYSDTVEKKGIKVTKDTVVKFLEAFVLAVGITADIIIQPGNMPSEDKIILGKLPIRVGLKDMYALVTIQVINLAANQYLIRVNDPDSVTPVTFGEW